MSGGRSWCEAAAAAHMHAHAALRAQRRACCVRAHGARARACCRATCVPARVQLTDAAHCGKMVVLLNLLRMWHADGDKGARARLVRGVACEAFKTLLVSRAAGAHSAVSRAALAHSQAPPPPPPPTHSPHLLQQRAHAQDPAGLHRARELLIPVHRRCGGGGHAGKQGGMHGGIGDLCLAAPCLRRGPLLGGDLHRLKGQALTLTPTTRRAARAQAASRAASARTWPTSLTRAPPASSCSCPRPRAAWGSTSRQRTRSSCLTQAGTPPTTCRRAGVGGAGCT